MFKSVLAKKLVKPTTIAILIILLVSVFYSYVAKTNNAEYLMEREASMLVTQMNAVWDYIADNQEAIETGSTGIIDYKEIHCAIAGVSIANAITGNNDYVIRFAKNDARNDSNNADPLEQTAITYFTQNPDATSYWEYQDYSFKEYNSYFRYFEPIYVEESCLECHGDPVGEIDKSGYAKEGYEVGEIIGVTSIGIPTEPYTEDMLMEIVLEAALFIVLITICVFIIYFFMKRFITDPLDELEKMAEQIGTGEGNIDLTHFTSDDEITSLAKKFTNMAEQINTLTTGLEDEIDQRTEQLIKANDFLVKQQLLLEEANDRLSKESEYKSEFLAIMSHELKTPLAAIITFTEILQDMGDENTAVHTDICEEMLKNSTILLSLINNILEMARIDAGKVVVKKDVVDWLEIWGNLKSTISPLTKQKNIEFITSIAPDLPLMIGDFDKLRRMVENLLSNAVKFTEENGKIEMTFTYDEMGEKLFIKVEDNGVGIKKSDIPYIFEKFVQSDSSTKRHIGGTGLGLALAQSIAQMHGGHISVVSVENEGSCFTIELPVILHI